MVVTAQLDMSAIAVVICVLKMLSNAKIISF
jgi:hypothetical protein